MSLKSFVTNVWKKLITFVKKTYKKVDELANKFCPIAINVVEAMKKVNEGTVGDVIEFIVTTAIPGNKDDIVVKALRGKLKLILPKIITQLTIVNSIAEIEDETKNALYHSFGALALEKLSDGKLSWSEAVQLTEWWYLNIYKAGK